MTIATAVAALPSSPFAADPVGTKRVQRDFANDPENPTGFRSPYGGASLNQNPLKLVFGIREELPARLAEAATALGYNPDDAFLIVSDADLDVDMDEDVASRITEAWVSFWHVDGNTPDPEDGALRDTGTTLVRLI